MGPKSNAWCPNKRPNENAQGRGFVMVEAEIRVMWPQAKDCGHQRLAKARTDPPLEPTERALPCPHPDFSLLAPVDVREPSSVAQSPPVR